jgi:8-oxo-dGTP pyrophosphatase MutT (NUDIX family)
VAGECRDRCERDEEQPHCWITACTIISSHMQRHGPWTIEESSQKFANKFVSVHEDRVKQPDGSDGTYATVTLNSGVAVLALDDRQEVQLTKQFRYAIGRDSIEVVSGAIDEGESPLHAGQRELREELGFIADEWHDLGCIDVDTSILRCAVHLFAARGLHKTQVDRDPSERIQPLAADLDEVIRMVMDGEITHSPSCVLILKAAQSDELRHHGGDRGSGPDA